MDVILDLFIDTIKYLEGDNKIAVEDKLLIRELEKTYKFTKKDAENYIRKMLRTASIYESIPHHYNLI